MRVCPVVTADVLERVLQRRVAAGERTALLRHLREPCEACLDLLEEHRTDELLASLLAPEKMLSRTEQEHIFAAAAAPAGLFSGAVMEPTTSGTPRGKVRRMRRFAWGAAAAGAVVLFGLLTEVRQPPHATGESGRKGLATPTVALIPLVGARTPTPHVVRALGRDSSFATGELLLLRIRLSTPAWVYLFSQNEHGATELLWPLRATARHDAGEFEVAESASVMAIDPVALGKEARLLLLACPEQLDASRLQTRDPLRRHEPPSTAFPGCGVDLLPIRMGGH